MEPHAIETAKIVTQGAMDWGIFCTVIGVGIGITAFVYQFLRNFKSDIKELIAAQDRKFDSFEKKFEILDNRLFAIAMGKNIKEVLKEEKKQ